MASIVGAPRVEFVVPSREPAVVAVGGPQETDHLGLGRNGSTADRELCARLAKGIMRVGAV